MDWTDNKAERLVCFSEESGGRSYAAAPRGNPGG